MKLFFLAKKKRIIFIMTKGDALLLAVQKLSSSVINFPNET